MNKLIKYDLFAILAIVFFAFLKIFIPNTPKDKNYSEINYYIGSPTDESTFIYGDKIKLSAGGDKSPKSFDWSYDIKRISLGQGKIIEIPAEVLGEGLHAIYLKVTTDKGVEYRSSINIRVYRERSNSYYNLSVQPLYFNIGDFEQLEDSYQVFVIREPNGTINWKAETDVDWIKLSSYSGTTPSDLTFSILKYKLSPGGHEGKIKFVSPETKEWETVEVKICARERNDTTTDCSEVFPRIKL